MTVFKISNNVSGLEFNIEQFSGEKSADRDHIKKGMSYSADMGKHADSVQTNFVKC